MNSKHMQRSSRLPYSSGPAGNSRRQRGLHESPRVRLKSKQLVLYFFLLLVVAALILMFCLPGGLTELVESIKHPPVSVLLTYLQ
jgi:hypothetical protein